MRPASESSRIACATAWATPQRLDMLHGRVPAWPAGLCLANRLLSVASSSASFPDLLAEAPEPLHARSRRRAHRSPSFGRPTHLPAGQ